MTRLAVLDSNAIDPFLDDPAALSLAAAAVADGRLQILATHVTVDEVAKTPDPERRASLLQVLARLAQRVPTFGVILGVSRVGEAMLNDDVAGLEALRSHNAKKHSKDALIAATAQFHGAALITNDRRLARRARNQGITVLTTAQLLTELNEAGPAS